MGKWIHRISNVDPIARKGDCAHCGRVTVKRKNLSGWACRRAAYKWSRSSETAGGKRQRERLLSAQGSLCAVCGETLTPATAKLDHSHSSGMVRGMLCRDCNLGLGCFRDAPDRLQRAIAYLAAGDTGETLLGAARCRARRRGRLPASNDSAATSGICVAPENKKAPLSAEAERGK